MTNNLKITIILSIFVSILTGYFCFSSPSFVKNQAISNNNDEDKKVTENKSENKNKEKEEVSSKPSRINLRLIIFISFFIIIFIIIFIFIIAVTTFIIIRLNKFKFNEASKEDFVKENFCPIFFMIAPSKIKDFLEKKIVNDVKEDAECFFEILAKLIFLHDDVNNVEDIEDIESLDFLLRNTKNFIYFNEKSNKKNINIYTDSISLNLKYILDKIYSFAFSVEHIKPERAIQLIQPIKKEFDTKVFKSEKQKIKQKYGKEFDSYLCAYLLYYLFEVIGNRAKVKIFYFENDMKKKESIEETFTSESEMTLLSVESTEHYNINYDIISKILKKLLNDKPIKNVKI